MNCPHSPWHSICYAFDIIFFPSHYGWQGIKKKDKKNEGKKKPNIWIICQPDLWIATSFSILYTYQIIQTADFEWQLDQPPAMKGPNMEPWGTVGILERDQHVQEVLGGVHGPEGT